ncbi:MAG: hypothetical protein GY906_01530 [bacterium]|nr:hypothetical protein [bacterium]
MKLSRLIMIATLAVLLLPEAALIHAQEPEDPVSAQTKSNAAKTDVQTTTQSATPDATPVPVPPDPATIAVQRLMAWQRAEADLALADLSESDASPKSLIAKSLAKAADRDYDGSLSLLQQAAVADSSAPAAPYYSGEVFLMKRDMGQANAAWRVAQERAGALMAQNADDANALYYLGAAEVRLRQFDVARTHLEQAKVAGFDPLLVSYQVALSFAFQQQWPQAKEALDAVLLLDQRFAHAYYYRALVWDKLKRKDQFFIDLDQFVKLAPTALEANRARALLATSKR